MATRKFWFPSQAGSFYTAFGSIRIMIQHTIAGGTNYNHDLNIIPSEMGKLEFDFEITSGGDTMRFPHIKFKFPNIGNILQTPNLLIDEINQKYQTFITIIKDGTDLWWGIIDYNTVVYSEMYLDSGTWKYRYLEFEAYDRLAFFRWNNILINTYFTNPEYFVTNWFEIIFALIGISTGDIVWDTNLGFTEECGHTYGYDDLQLISCGLCVQIYEFLRAFIMVMAALIYNWNGKYYIKKRIAGSTTTILYDDIIGEVEKVPENRLVNYVKMQSTKNWSYEGCDMTDYIHAFYYGDQASDYKFEYLDPFTLLMAFFVSNDITPGTYPPDTVYDDVAADTIELNAWKFHDADRDYYTNGIESGQFLEYYSGDYYKVPILTVPTLVYVTAAAGGPIPPAGPGYYQITKKPDIYAPYKLFKIHTLLKKAVLAYSEWHSTSKDLLKIRLRKIASYINFHNRFVFDSQNHRIAKVNVDFLNNRLELILRRVT